MFVSLLVIIIIKHRCTSTFTLIKVVTPLRHCSAMRTDNRSQLTLLSNKDWNERQISIGISERNAVAFSLLRTDLINMFRFKGVYLPLNCQTIYENIWVHPIIIDIHLFQRKKIPLTLQNSAQRSFPYSPKQLYLFERQWVLYSHTAKIA